MTSRIAFQGALGAYSHEACVAYRPDMEPFPCKTFGDVLRAVRDSDAELAMLPVENSSYGRVADSHRLLPESGLHIVDECFTWTKFVADIWCSIFLCEDRSFTHMSFYAKSSRRN